MNLSLDLITTLGLPNVKEVFKNILVNRTASRYQLEMNKFSLQIEKNEDLDDALNKLQSAGLIDKKSAGGPEFDVFFPTEQGLNIERTLNKL